MNKNIYSTECSKCGGGTNQAHACLCAVRSQNKRQELLIMKDKILAWYANGQKGVSSEAIAQVAIGNKPSEEWATNHPSDPSDFNRCLMLIEAVPEIKSHMHKVAKLSAVWDRLVSNWDEIEKSFIDEAGLNWSKSKSAPKTYDLMKLIIKGRNENRIRI